MIGRQDADRLGGTTAYAEDGSKIGEVDTVYVDADTHEPKFVLVNTGLFGMRSSFAPLEGARLDGDELRLPFTKDQVKDAPNMEADGDLDPGEEQEIFRYYGIGEATTPGHRTVDADAGLERNTDTSRNTSGRGTSETDTGEAMTRSEQELDVGKTRHETGRARLRKHVVTENVTKTVPVEREEVRVEHEPIEDEDRAMAGEPELSDEEREVVLHEEEPVVEKHTVPKERVRLDKTTHTDEEQVDEEVAHERIDVTDPESAQRRDR